VVTVSSIGALVRTAHRPQPGAQWPLLLDVSNTPVQLTARVVRCEPVAGLLSSSTGLFTLALAFVSPSAEAKARLDRYAEPGAAPKATPTRVRRIPRRLPPLRALSH